MTTTTGATARHRVAARSTLSWRVVVDHPRTGAQNMALDHALTLALARGAGIMRLYTWTRPTVSFGRNEPARDHYSSGRAGEMQTDFVRRPTGGRAVLHDDELTYMIAVPARATGGARETYRRVNRGLAMGIRSLGVEVDLEPDGATPGLDAGPCFQGPAGGELVAGGRKLVGSAQARIGSALLQHGSIILGGDPSPVWDRYGGYRWQPAANLHDLAPGLHLDALRKALVEGVAETMGGAWTSGGLDEGELSAARTLEQERYGTEEWTWRR